MQSLVRGSDLQSAATNMAFPSTVRIAHHVYKERLKELETPSPTKYLPISGHDLNSHPKPGNDA
jgi:hypothetical protein